MPTIILFSFLFLLNFSISLLLYACKSYKSSLLNAFCCGLSFAVVLHEILN